MKRYGRTGITVKDYINYAKWLPMRGGQYACSECWHKTDFRTDICPSCHSQMDVSDEEEFNDDEETGTNSEEEN